MPSELLASCKFGQHDYCVPVYTAVYVLTTAVVCSPWSVRHCFSAFKGQRGKSIPHVTPLNLQLPYLEAATLHSSSFFSVICFIYLNAVLIMLFLEFSALGIIY